MGASGRSFEGSGKISPEEIEKRQCIAYASRMKSDNEAGFIHCREKGFLVD